MIVYNLMNMCISSISACTCIEKISQRGGAGCANGIPYKSEGLPDSGRGGVGRGCDVGGRLELNERSISIIFN